MLRLLITIASSSVAGAVFAHYHQNHAGCPLRSEWWRGAVAGGIGGIIVYVVFK
jgi:hypothetical protein